MSVYKRGKYRIVQFNHNKKTYTRSSKSTRKRDALELERQTRQQLVDTQVLGHREHIKLREACDALLSTSKASGAYDTLVTATNRFKDVCSRNAGYPAPPAQSRTCGIAASGSSVVLAFAQDRTIMRTPSGATPP